MVVSHADSNVIHMYGYKMYLLLLRYLVSTWLIHSLQFKNKLKKVILKSKSRLKQADIFSIKYMTNWNMLTLTHMPGPEQVPMHVLMVATTNNHNCLWTSQINNGCAISISSMYEILFLYKHNQLANYIQAM